MALHASDYDAAADAWVIQRGISARRVSDRTKTGEIHVIPNLSAFHHWHEEALARRRAIGPVGPFLFAHALSRSAGKRYTDSVLCKLWNDAAALHGETVSLYEGLKHSSCSQYVNEKGVSPSDLREITDHARMDSVRRYAKMEMARKRAIMETPPSVERRQKKPKNSS